MKHEGNKELDLEYFKITGDIVKWQGTVIKIGNISYVTREKFELPGFPKMSVILVLIGLFMCSFNALAGIGGMAAGILWIFFWYLRREDLKNKTVLTLSMNSGTRIPILFHNKDFLDKVLKVLEEVMKKGDIGTQNITISISNCDISGNARILTDMGIN